MSKIKDFKYAVVYTDNGPGGPCGQSCDTTSCWVKVWLFTSMDMAREFINMHPLPKRKRSRYDIVCTEGEDYFSHVQSLEFVK